MKHTPELYSSVAVGADGGVDVRTAASSGGVHLGQFVCLEREGMKHTLRVVIHLLLLLLLVVMMVGGPPAAAGLHLIKLRELWMVLKIKARGGVPYFAGKGPSDQQRVDE